MQIVVCISCVPDTTSKINFVENNRVFSRDGVQFIINPNDEFGLTKAVFIKEKNQAEITVISVGDSTIDPILRKCLAIGADRAIRIDNEASDSISVAKNISNFLKKNKFDLIIMGKESADYNGGIVHGIVAEELAIPHINACVGFEIIEDYIIVERETEGGKEKLKLKMPAIIAGQKGLVEEKDLKIPNMRGIMQSRTKPLNVIESTEFNYIKSISFSKPEENKECIFIEKDKISELVKILNKNEKVL